MLNFTFVTKSLLISGLHWDVGVVSHSCLVLRILTLINKQNSIDPCHEGQEIQAFRLKQDTFTFVSETKI